jgi:hypothetical protein
VNDADPEDGEVTDEQLAAGKVFGPTVDLDRVRREARDDPEPELGAAFARLQQPGVFIADAVNADDERVRPPALRVTDHTGSPEPMRPQDRLPPPPLDPLAALAGAEPRPVEPAVEVNPGTQRVLTVQRTGDDEADAMLMLRAVMEGQPRPAQRRLLGYLADRYA